MDTRDVGLGQIGISINNFLNHLASLQHEVKAINFVAMVESAIQVCFFELHKIALPPRLKIYPLVDVWASQSVIQLASENPSKAKGYPV